MIGGTSINSHYHWLNRYRKHIIGIELARSPTIHRGLEWPQFLNSLFSICLIVCSLSANFLISYSTVKYSIVQYSTVQYSTVQYSKAQRSYGITDLFIIVQYSTVHYSTVQYSTVQYSTVQYCTVHYSTVQ